MRKIALISAVAITFGVMAVDTADARPRGYGYGNGGYGYGGYGRGGYGRGYAYRGGRRGIGTGAAVGLGIAGLAAGVIAAEGARRAYAPRYGYGYYDEGY